MTIDTNNWFANLGNFPKFDAIPGADRFQSLLTDAGERNQEAVRRSTEVAEELADVAKANVEAFVTAGRIAATGAKSLGQDIVARGREGVEQAADAIRSLADRLAAIERRLAELDGRDGEAEVRELKPKRGPSSAGG